MSRPSSPTGWVAIRALLEARQKREESLLLLAHKSGLATIKAASSPSIISGLVTLSHIVLLATTWWLYGTSLAPIAAVEDIKSHILPMATAILRSSLCFLASIALAAVPAHAPAWRAAAVVVKATHWVMPGALFLRDSGSTIAAHGLFNFTVWVLVCLPVVAAGVVALRCGHACRRSPQAAAVGALALITLLAAGLMQINRMHDSIALWRARWVSGPIAGPMKTRLYRHWQQRAAALESVPLLPSGGHLLRGALGVNDTVAHSDGVGAGSFKGSTAWTGCELLEYAHIRVPYVDALHEYLPGWMNAWAGPKSCVGIVAAGGEAVWQSGTGSTPAQPEPQPLLPPQRSPAGAAPAVPVVGFGVQLVWPVSTGELASALTAAGGAEVDGSAAGTLAGRTCSDGPININAAGRAFGTVAGGLHFRDTAEADHWTGIVLGSSDGALPPVLPSNLDTPAALLSANTSGVPLEALHLPVVLRIACPAEQPLSYSLYPETKAAPFNLRVKRSRDSMHVGDGVEAGAVARTRLIPPRPRGASVTDVLLPAWVTGESAIVRCGPIAAQPPRQQLDADMSKASASGIWRPWDATDRRHLAFARPSYATVRRLAAVWGSSALAPSGPPAAGGATHASTSPEEASAPSPRPPNVLIIMMDAVSRLHAVRKLPATMAAMQRLQRFDAMDVFEFLRYHASGFSTGLSTIPLYTGWGHDRLHEQPEHDGWADSSANFTQALSSLREGIDAAIAATEATAQPSGDAIGDIHWPVMVPLWRRFSRSAGYVTASVSNECEEWSSTYGWTLEPTDHEQHAMYCLPPYHPRPEPYGPFDGPYSIRSRCLASQRAHDGVFDYVRSVWAAYPSAPKFVVASLIEGHEGTGEVIADVDSSLASLLDDILAHKRGADDTVVLVMSDHGLHMAPAMPFSVQNTVEHQLPLLVTLWPRVDRLPIVTAQDRAHLRDNQHSLIAAADIHATLVDLLDRVASVVTAADATFPCRLAATNSECAAMWLPPREARYDDRRLDWYATYRQVVRDAGVPACAALGGAHGSPLVPLPDASVMAPSGSVGRVLYGAIREDRYCYDAGVPQDLCKCHALAEETFPVYSSLASAPSV